MQGLDQLKADLSALPAEERESRRGRRQEKRLLAKEKEHARAEFRLIAAALIAHGRHADKPALAELVAARERGALRSRESEHWFRVYVHQRLATSSLTRHERDEIFDVMVSMTGLDGYDGRLGDVAIDIVIALANAGELEPCAVSEDLMFLKKDEDAFVQRPGELWEPTRVQVSETAKASLAGPIAPGAKVGLEHARTVTTERPGDFESVASGVILVTSQRTVFMNGRTVDVAHGDLLRLGVERHFCLLHHTGSPSPVMIRVANEGALIGAAINMARRGL